MFCTTIKRIFCPVIVKRGYGHNYMGYFLIDSSLHGLGLGNYKFDYEELVTKFNKWLVTNGGAALLNYRRGGCERCQALNSFSPKDSKLSCTVCGYFVG